MRALKSTLRGVLVTIFGLALRRRFKTLQIGASSQVFFWRVRTADGVHLKVGDISRVETRLTLEREGAYLSVGTRTFIGEGHISCASRIEIGDDVMVAWNTTIFDHGSHSIKFSERSGDVVAWLEGQKRWEVVATKPVKVGNKAWIGYGSIILPGIEIGEGAIVGAGSVVTRDVPEWSIVAGNPAKVIRMIAEHER